MQFMKLSVVGLKSVIWKIHFDFQLFDICGRHPYLIYDFMNKVP